MSPPLVRPTRISALLAAVVCLFGLFALPVLSADDGLRLIRVDHYVKVKSTAPAMNGGDALLYVREVVLAGTVLRGGPAANRGVVLFVHGSGVPSEAAFDVPYQDYSWMAYLAKAGFDVFAMDLTGYGRSTRPAPMLDAYNFPQEAQAQFAPGVIPAPGPPTYTAPITTMGSDWNDIDAVVDRLRSLRHAEKISLIAWSQGGPRAAGYAARNPAKVARLVALAPAYDRAGPLEETKGLSFPNGSMSAQSRADFNALWDSQVGGPGQYDPEASEAVWSEILASDPVGATWGPGVRRAPRVPTWGFNQAVVAKMETPFLMISGTYDKQVLPERVRELYADLGSKQKVFVELGMSSHNAHWEKNHLLLYRLSLEWLTDGKVEGQSEGMLKLGFAP